LSGEPTHFRDRRQALVQLGSIVAGLVLPWTGSIATAQARPSFDISLAEWSLHRMLFAGAIDHLDFARIARGAFDINAVEYVNQFFRDRVRDHAYLDQMRHRAEDAGVRSLLIMVDGEGLLGARSQGQRRRAVERHARWAEAARRVGCHAIRVNAHGEGPPDRQLLQAADGIRRLCDAADDHDIDVLIENHGGCSSDAAWLASLVDAVGHHRCGSLPDFGNFRGADGGPADAYRAVERLMPSARAVSAKTRDFDERGQETSIDFRRMLRLVTAAGYDGHVGIEYEGRRIGEAEGVRRSATLLRRVRDEIDVGG
jgi:sugar phosphate isomerase/epimerase